MGTSINIIHTEQAPKAVGPYSQAIDSGSLVFVSGQLGLNPSTGEFAGEDFISQAKQALENIQAILEAADLGMDQILAVDVFLTDMTQYQTFNNVYKSYLGTHKPARAVVEVSALPRGGLVEIKCCAQRA